MDRIEAIRSRLKSAHTMVSDLCHGKRDWIMSIPAQRDYDPDLVIGAALSDGDRMVDIAEASMALYRAEQAYDTASNASDPGWAEGMNEAHSNLIVARAAWNAACAKWEANG